MVLKNILKVLINKNLSLIRERLCYFVTNYYAFTANKFTVLATVSRISVLLTIKSTKPFS